MAIIVEFVGHSGSGKTFLKDQLLSKLKGAADVSSQDRLRLWDVMVLVALKPDIIGLICQMVYDSKPKSFRHAWRALFKMTAYQVKMEKALGKDSRWVICSEGMLHRFRMLKAGGRASDLSYGRLRPRVRERIFRNPDFVIFVVATLDTIAERLVERGDGEASTEGELAMVARKRGTFDLSIAGTEEDILKAQGEHGFRYLKVINEDSDQVELNVKMIHQEIASLEEEIKRRAPAGSRDGIRSTRFPAREILLILVSCVVYQCFSSW